MNRSQKFLGITLMASLLCGFTLCKARPRSTKSEGCTLTTITTGAMRTGGSTSSTPPRWPIEDINASGMLGGNTLNMPPELVIDYHCWPEGAAEKAGHS